MKFKAVLLLLVTLQQIASGSDIQAYPGGQFRIDDSFLNLISEEIFYIIPKVVEKITSIIPQQFKFFFITVNEIRATDFALDTTRGDFHIDQVNKGIMMVWPTLKTFNIHFKVDIKYLFLFHWYLKVDINLKDVLLDNGFSITADTKTGTPVLKFFNTHIDLGKSKLALGGNLAAWIINWFTVFFKVPV